jgi:CBS domain-containing protein
MQASSNMTRDVIVVPPSVRLEDAWALMKKSHVRHLPVVRANALIGILSDRDILRRGTLDEDGVLHVPENAIVGDAMTPTPVKTCEATTDVSEVARMMVEEKIDAVPVVRGLRLVGLVTTSDLLSLLMRSDGERPLPFDFKLIDDHPA